MKDLSLSLGTFDLTINVISDSCAGWNCEPGAHVVLSCQFICGDADHVGTPTLREVVGGKSKRLQTTAGPACVGGRLSSSVDYAIPPSSTSGEHTYRCQFPGFNSTRTNVTLTFYGEHHRWYCSPMCRYISHQKERRQWFYKVLVKARWSSNVRTM